MKVGNWLKAAGVLVCGAGLLLLGSQRLAFAADAPAAYVAKCQSCHGPQGKGDGPAGKAIKPPATDLTDAAKAKLKTAEEITNLLKKGGKEVGLAPIHAPMTKLSDEEIAGLVKFCEELKK
jgi:mono/diheme cytochrome c family protein